MKALTLTQPWATLVAIGAKRIETRSWSTPHRGPLAIHAGKGLGPVGGKRGLALLCERPPFREVLADIDLPLGAVVATCELIACLPTNGLKARMESLPRLDDFQPAEHERSFGDYGPGRFAWFIDAVRPTDQVPCDGRLQLWDLQKAAHGAEEPETERRLLAILDAHGGPEPKAEGSP